MPEPARIALEAALARRASPTELRAFYIQVTESLGITDSAAHRLEELLEADSPVLRRARGAGCIPEDLFGVHELAELLVMRTVRRCLGEDDLDTSECGTVAARIMTALGTNAAVLQRRLLMHPRIHRVVHFSRLLRGSDLAPARQAYLESTGIEPARSVVGYCEVAQNGTPEDRRGLVDWSEPSMSHLALRCGLRVPVTTAPTIDNFSALELLRRDTEPFDNRRVSPDRLKHEPAVPAFYPSADGMLQIPVIDALLVVLSRTVVGHRTSHVRTRLPDAGVAPRSALDGLRLHPWIAGAPQGIRRFLASAAALEGVEPSEAIDWERIAWRGCWWYLKHGLEDLASRALHEPLRFRALAERWLHEPIPRVHPDGRARSRGRPSFDLDLVESPLDQRLARILITHGTHPEELLLWMLNEWTDARAALTHLGKRAGLDGNSVVGCMHALAATRSASAEAKAISTAGRQAWCLVEVDRMVRNRLGTTGDARAEAAALCHRLPAEPWPARTVTTDGVFDPDRLEWP